METEPHHQVRRKLRLTTANNLDVHKAAELALQDGTDAVRGCLRLLRGLGRRRPQVVQVSVRHPNLAMGAETRAEAEADTGGETP